MGIMQKAQSVLAYLEAQKASLASNPPTDAYGRRRREQEFLVLNEDIHTVKLFMSMIPKWEDIQTKVRTLK